MQGCLTYFQIQKRNVKEYLNYFLLIFFSPLDPKTTKNICMRLKLNVPHAVKHHPELRLGSSLFQEDLPKLVFTTAVYNCEQIRSFLLLLSVV